MSKIQINGVQLNVFDTVSGEEPILFCHGLIWDHRLFEHQIEFLKPHYRCVAFDFRGQGQSEVCHEGYDMDSLTQDAREIIGTLELGPCHLVGLSMGGFVALRLAARYPDLVRSMTLLNTSAELEPNRFKYNLLNLIARWFGIGVVASRVMPIMFGSTFLKDPAREAERRLYRQRMVANDRIGLSRAVKGVVDREAVISELKSIVAPTLVVACSEDKGTTPDKAATIHAKIAGSRLETVKAAGHTSTWEQPEAINLLIRDFLHSLGS